MLKKIIAQTQCLLMPDDAEWSNIKRLVVELGMLNAEGRIVWKNAGAHRTEEGVSTSFVPAIWDQKSAEMVMVFEWLTDPAFSGEKKGANIFYYRKLIVRNNGKIREYPVVKFRRQHTDSHFMIIIRLNDG